jgi:hypothetical protein
MARSSPLFLGICVSQKLLTALSAGRGFAARLFWSIYPAYGSRWQRADIDISVFKP